MDEPTTHELAALRARAYGPRADIDGDPVAIARLRELETAARIAAEPTQSVREAAPSEDDSDTADDAADAAADDTAANAGADDVDALRLLVADSTGVAGPRAPRPVRVGWVIAWAASVLVVALTVGGMVFALASIRPVSPVTGATQVASLDDPVPTDDTVWVQRWFGGASGEIVAFDYLGLVVIQTPSLYYSTGQECLVVAPRDGFNEENDSFEGAMYTGCRAGSFPAAVQFVVNESAPQEVRDLFADGTGLSFVLDGDVVGVFTDGGPQATGAVRAGR